MKRIHLLFLCIFLSSAALTQKLHIGVFGGASAYLGDLTENIFPKKSSNGVIALTGTYELSDQIMVRAGFAYTMVGGADQYMNKDDLKLRNFSFKTTITELSLVGEYYLHNLNERRYSPYFMAGLAVFKFNPYTYYGNQKVFLKPLSTEGQGISGYGKNYSLTQMAIPAGGGIKFAINDNFRIGLEGSVRKLFTDYLDDVSGNFADPADLLAAKGQLSVDLSYRSDEVGGPIIYPDKGYQRGNPKMKDIYYFAGIHLTYRLGTGNGVGGGHKSGMGCPTNVY
jgi:hypothetical protein